MPPAARRTLVAFIGWTAFVWSTRIRNVWSDAEAGTWEQVSSTALSLALLAGAAAVGVALAQAWRSRRGLRPWGATAVDVLAVGTIGVWIVRGAQIATAGHEVGFVVVHLALAGVSIGLAAAARRQVRATSGHPVPVALP